IMSIYMTSLGLPKEQFMGTTAWFYFLLNSAKLPLYFGLTLLNPDQPFVTPASLRFDLMLSPVILAGVFLGRWLLPGIGQKSFDALVLSLAAIAALKLLLAP